ncbi:MAG TPA: hypothetical protein VEV41_05945 [Terriglobales bacterium]|nr:hypothetical protein [Terriglobales bacterium]
MDLMVSDFSWGMRVHYAFLYFFEKRSRRFKLSVYIERIDDCQSQLVDNLGVFDFVHLQVEFIHPPVKSSIRFFLCPDSILETSQGRIPAAAEPHPLEPGVPELKHSRKLPTGCPGQSPR